MILWVAFDDKILKALLDTVTRTSYIVCVSQFGAYKPETKEEAMSYEIKRLCGANYRPKGSGWGTTWMDVK